MMIRLLPALLLASIPAFPGGVHSEVVKPNHVAVEWISEVKAIQPGTPFWVALRLAHDPHWHTYWKNPGDSGLATKVDWRLPAGFEVSDAHWPVPLWQSMGGVAVFGYEDEAFLLFELRPPKDLPVGGLVQIGAAVSWLECSETCIPGRGELRFELPVRTEALAEDPAVVNAFSLARSRLPASGSGWRGSAVEKEAHIDLSFEAPGSIAGDVGVVRFFPAAPYLFDYTDGLPVLRRGNTFTISAVISTSGGELPEHGIRGLLAAEKGWDGKGTRQGVEIVAPLGGSEGASVRGGTPALSMGKAILFAVLGGMILNLMPCVFPVISLKILGFVNLAGENPKVVWRHGLSFAAGVMVSFWVLAGIILALKLVWAGQFTNPYFVISMCILFLLLGLSLFGVFEIGTTLTCIGGQVRETGGLAGSFFSGALATLVATPCVAPFMGAAILFASTQPAMIAFIVFSFIGIGMALPYLLLSRFPGWLKALPPPGPWMESLKQFMGFLLLGFALFLVWVVSNMPGDERLGRLLLGLLLVGVAAWVYGRWGALSRAVATRIRGSIVALVLFVGGSTYAMSTSGYQWIEYSPELVEELRDEGTPVFIDFTASWCVTCQLNKKAVLNTRKVQRAFDSFGVTRVVADWTDQEEPITSALESFGVGGVPLCVLYGKDPEAEPLTWKGTLTRGMVIDALEKM